MRRELDGAARLIFTFATELAGAGLVPPGGLNLPAHLGSGRARNLLRIQPDGAVDLVHYYPPYMGGSERVRTPGELLGAQPIAAAVVRDVAAAIESGEIWERVLGEVGRRRSGNAP